MDVTQAFPQSAKSLQRKIFIKRDVLDLQDDELLQLVKPTYGLNDSGDYFDKTLNDHQKTLIEYE